MHTALSLLPVFGCAFVLSVLMLLIVGNDVLDAYSAMRQTTLRAFLTRIGSFSSTGLLCCGFYALTDYIVLHAYGRSIPLSFGGYIGFGYFCGMLLILGNGRPGQGMRWMYFHFKMCRPGGK